MLSKFLEAEKSPCWNAISIHLSFSSPTVQLLLPSGATYNTMIY